jgi:hypothetical protein
MRPSPRTGLRDVRRGLRNGAPNWPAGSSTTQRYGSASRAHRRTCNTGYACSGSLGPWLADWEKQTGPLIDRRLDEAAGEGEYELLEDSLPWGVCWYEHDEEQMTGASQASAH